MEVYDNQVTSSQEKPGFVCPGENASEYPVGVRFRGYKVTIQRLLEAELEDEQTHRQQTVDFLRQSK
jgi:hypothetical protein